MEARPEDYESKGPRNSEDMLWLPLDAYSLAPGPRVRNCANADRGVTTCRIRCPTVTTPAPIPMGHRITSLAGSILLADRDR